MMPQRPGQTSPLQQLNNLLETHDTIAHDMAAASERLQPTYEIALAAARTALTGCLQEPGVQSEVALQDKQLKADIAVVESLTTNGLLTGEQAESELERIMRHPDYRLLRIARRLGSTVVAEALKDEPISPPPVSLSVASGNPKRPVASTPKKAEPSKAESGVAAKNAVKVTITPTATIVNGKHFPDTIYGDYKERRIAVLRALQSIEIDEELSPYQLWELAFPHIPFEKTEIQVIKGWMDKHLVTPSGQQLLRHNGKRGKNSRYIKNEEVAYELRDTTMPAIHTVANSTSRPLQHTEKVEDYTATPTLEDMQLVRIAVTEMIEQLGDSLDASVFDPELVKVPDLSGLTDQDMAKLAAFTRLRIKLIADCTGPKMEVFRGVQQENSQVIRFLDTIMPIIKQCAPIVEDAKEMRRIVAEALNKHRK
ncbi:MAG: hypothetical protein JWP13_390 [Candidatus Saccharibacteria bacterium]|nr:hypothetical protein [Candidatus Saccharibacteria bacterium]